MTLPGWVAARLGAAPTASAITVAAARSAARRPACSGGLRKRKLRLAGILPPLIGWAEAKRRSVLPECVGGARPWTWRAYPCASMDASGSRQQHDHLRGGIGAGAACPW